MFWDECIEKTLYRRICEGENVLYLNGKNVLYPKTAEIILSYIKKDLSNILGLRRCLQKNKNMVQFVCLRCFPEIYSLIDKRGIQIKSEFLLEFKAWKDNFSSAYSRFFYKQKANDFDVDLPSVIAEPVVRQGKPLSEDITKIY